MDNNINIQNYYYKNNFIIKHELSTFDDDESIYTKQNFRAMPDKSTSAFVDIFLKNDSDRYNFIDYTYHKINSNIHTKINKYLIDNNQDPICANEEIIFYFKGGNIMVEQTKELFNNGPGNDIKNTNLSIVKETFMNATIDDFIQDPNGNKITFGDLFGLLKQQFSISDIDYSILIVANNYLRYKVIYTYVARIIIESLNEISIFFDNLYTNEQPIEIYDRSIPINVQNEKKTSDAEHNESNLNLLYFFISRLKEIKTNENPKQNIAQVMDDLTKLGEYVNIVGPLSLCVLFNIYELFHHIYNNQIYAKKKNQVMQNIENMINYKQRKLVQSQFYTKDKFDEYKQKLVTLLNNELIDKLLFKVTYTGNDIIETAVTLTKWATVNDITIDPRDNFYTKYTDDPLHISKSGPLAPKRYHYITANHLINRVRFNRKNVTNFDLFRIKFNTKISNCVDIKTNSPQNERKRKRKRSNGGNINIPSEFIDISVPQYGSDNVNIEHAKQIHINMCDFKNGTENHLQLYSYTLKEIVKDLEYVLFTQNYFCPWIDKKYIKRIYRLILLSWYYLSQNNMLNIFLDILNFNDAVLKYILNDTMPYPYEAIQKVVHRGSDIANVLDDIIDLNINNVTSLYKNIIIKNKYEILSEYIKCIILLSQLYRCPVDKYYGYISLLREEYNYVSFSESSEKVVSDYKENSITMMKNFNNTGYYLLYYGQHNGSYNIDIMNVDDNVTTGGNTNNLEYKKYLKYKKKYMQLKKQKGGELYQEPPKKKLASNFSYPESMDTYDIKLNDFVNPFTTNVKNPFDNFTYPGLTDIFNTKVMNTGFTTQEEPLDYLSQETKTYSSGKSSITFTTINIPRIKERQTNVVPFSAIYDMD
jgi:hypothetical protein